MELKTFRLRSSPSFKSRNASLEDDQDADSTLTIQEKILQQEEDDRVPEGTDAKGFGEKNITFWGSCALNFNNITGPAMVVLPLLYQQAGWLLPSIALLGLWALSCVASAMLCEAMQRIPGNLAFARRFEYCPLVRHYLGKQCYYAAMVGFNAGLVASNIAAMIVTAQVLDALVSRMAGFTLGLSYGTWPPQLLADPLGSSAESCPWGRTGSGTCSTSVITLGYFNDVHDVTESSSYFVAAGLCIPLGLLSLGGNMALQWVSTVGQMGFSLHFVVHYLQGLSEASHQFCPGNGPSRTPLVGGDISQVMGLALFSFSYVSTIPSWVNEKRGGVPVNPSLWFPSLAAVSLNMTLAVLGAWSFRLLSDTGQPINGTENILSVLVGRAGQQSYCNTQQVPMQVQVAVYAWGLCGYLPGIPVLAIMVRYNLLNAKLMGPRGAFLTAVVLPWVLTAFFYRAEVLLQFCNWVAILCQGVVNFVVPPLLYRAALLAYPRPPPPPLPASHIPLLDSSPQETPSPLKRSPPSVYPLPRESGGMGSGGRKWRNNGTEAVIPYRRVLDGVDEPEQIAGRENKFVNEEDRSLNVMEDSVEGSSAERERWPAEEASFQEIILLGEATELQSFEKQGCGEEEGAGGAVRSVPRNGRRLWSWVLWEKLMSTGSGDDKGEEEPVDALPAWLGVDRIKFATCMALGLTILVGASITIAVVSAVWT